MKKPKDPTIAERMRRLRESHKAKGWGEVSVVIPKSRREDLKALAALWREQDEAANG